MSTLNKELVFLILQFLNEEGFKGAAHMLENETGFYFNMEFFGELILSGSWDEAERYLAGFTKLDDNRCSTKIFFEIRKQKFLEALDKNERAKALDILMKDLKVFTPNNEALFMEMTQLLTLNDIREHDSLSMYGDTESARQILMLEVKKIIEANPLFHDKLKFPSIRSQRLRRLINQGLNWQHIHCTLPQPNPNISTLFVDHVCLPPEDQLLSTSSDNNLLATSMPAPISPASSISTPSTVSHSEISSGAICLGGSTNLDGLKNTNGLSEIFPLETSNKETSAVTHPGESFFNIDNDFSTVIHPDQSIFKIPDDLPKSRQKNNTFESCRQINNTDLPKTVARILNEGSSPMSMDFHPVKQTILLVGTNMGDIGLWEVSSGEKLLSRNFKVWDIGACSMKFKAALLKDPCVSVNCIAWSPEGSLFGAAYSKHMVQIYSYVGANDVQQQMEIDAHVGGVNDLAFSAPEKKHLVITCGDDKMIKVWDVTTGVRMYSFEGHDAAIYSICPHSKEGIHFIFSTSVDGNIKAWLYDNMGARVDYDAPGLGCTSMAYSADDKRLFSCGTSKCGESFLVEWNESEGAIKRIYHGLQKNSLAVVQFDIMKNQFLAAGDEHVIKIWDVDNVDLFSTIDADGGLPANPRIRFNKDGTLLAVFANENRIKILATDCGLQLLHKSENCSVDDSRVLSDTFRKLAINPASTVTCAGVADEALENGDSKSLEAVKYEFTGKADQNLFEMNKRSQCQTLRLPSYIKANKISKLAYNNAGNAILALASNGIHLFWKWQLNDLNMSGKATTEVLPQQWQPKSGPRLMTNDLTDTKYGETLSCFALSKNDSYLMSSSGGKISLFNMVTFKTMLCIRPAPPATTSLAFLPQDNNVVAIGRDDSTILIYNVRLAKVISKLEGHSKRVSSLAFSKALNLLVSSGADSQILVWNVKGWEKHRSGFLQIPDEKKHEALLDTHVQFHQDQTRFLVVHESCLSIYEARDLECLKQWVRGDLVPISQATFSCDSQMVYATFVDGSVSIFDASRLELHCRITSTAYLPFSSCDDGYPLVIAAHPQKPNQFAVGLSNGGVIVFEPLNPAGKWSTLPPYEDGSEGAMPVESDVD
ncbi:hypothetical protein P3X46_019312 [Hevea brasiliensis]|uniref:CTLH domain-containing protein n=2 Tax=Hevea brasiliensis TaxID=3981 RepID=A0ABQ9LIA1_HEVBR|nr:protein TOPLESS [Hevea brasiliensis]KAJ9167704.1 hypothetical protein P3X46_019312 [Hevea brasiliensis]